MTEHARYKVLLLLIALTTVPFFFAVQTPTSWAIDSAGVKAIALYGSAVFGYIGVSLLMWQLIIGTRSIAGLFFVNLPEKLTLHRRIGTYGILVFLLHPALMLIAYAEPLTYLVTPNLSTGYETAVTYGRFALMTLLVIWVTSVVIRGKIGYRPWKYLHYLTYVIIVLVLLHAPEVGSSFTQPWVQFYWYSFVSIMLIAIALRLRHVFTYGKAPYRVVALQQLTTEVQSYTLEPLGKKLIPRIGQYIYIQRRLWGEEHPFTVVDHDPTTGKLLIVCKISGSFTKALAQTKRGETVLLDGPYGTFTYEHIVEPTDSSVFIAGGIGITPFVRHLLKQGTHAPAVLLYANRLPETAVYRDVLRRTLGNRYVDVFSQATPSQTATHGIEYGRMRTEIITKYVSDPTTKRYFICGPAGFITSVKSRLVELGVPAERIHDEAFNF